MGVLWLLFFWKIFKVYSFEIEFLKYSVGVFFVNIIIIEIVSIYIKIVIM